MSLVINDKYDVCNELIMYCISTLSVSLQVLSVTVGCVCGRAVREGYSTRARRLWETRTSVFTDRDHRIQKRKFFPHLEKESGPTNSPDRKAHSYRSGKFWSQEVKSDQSPGAQTYLGQGPRAWAYMRFLSQGMNEIAGQRFSQLSHNLDVFSTNCSHLT